MESSEKVVKEDGETYIKASQRPDGSWRKERKVKSGYTPQDEVPVYESRGSRSRFGGDEPTYPIGLSPAQIAAMAGPAKPKKKSKPKPPPTSSAEGEKKAVKKGRGFAIQTNSELRSLDPNSSTTLPEALGPGEKRRRALERKLGDIGVLEARAAAGETLEKNQVDKIATRPKLQEELDSLLLDLDSLNLS